MSTPTPEPDRPVEADPPEDELLLDPHETNPNEGDPDEAVAVNPPDPDEPR